MSSFTQTAPWLQAASRQLVMPRMGCSVTRRASGQFGDLGNPAAVDADSDYFVLQSGIGA